MLRRLNSIVPPRTVLNALARSTRSAPRRPGRCRRSRSTRACSQQPGVADGRGASVVRVLGTACGLGIEGSGWVAGPGLVVTAAHVVAGEHDTTVSQVSGPLAAARGGRVRRAATTSRCCACPGSGAAAQAWSSRSTERAVAIVGYPENGPLDAVPGRIGTTVERPHAGRVRARPGRANRDRLRGDVRHGNSGGPAVDAAGAVESTVFAARVNGSGGYGVPASVVRRDLANARVPVSTGPCT